ncbi:MAG: catalase family protein [Chloroflexota bacterium]
MSAPYGRDGGPGYGWPPADTGNVVLDRINDAANALIHWERRVDPFFRPSFDALLRDRLTRALTHAINARRRDEGYALAEERLLPNEDAVIDEIIATFDAQMRRLWNPRYFQRGGNTKTHGLVRAEVVIRDDVPVHMRHGIFRQPQTFKAWVRYSGPGPYWSADIDDIGFLSMAVKVMGVPGTKLLDEEKLTQDLFATSGPSFVTPDIRANAQLQKWSYQNAAAFYFLDPRQPHLLDAVMNFLWTRTQTSPFESDYFSTVPYLLGEGQAMQYAFRPRRRTRTPVPGLPGRPPDDYLRQAMVRTLDRTDVEFDLLVQMQTDPFLMPIENAAVVWPERLSPRIPVATIRIPRQTFASPEQIAFARVLAYNPWHAIPDHRPLGNVNRARRRMYAALAELRMKMNGVQHYEPTGDETFP